VVLFVAKINVKGFVEKVDVVELVDQLTLADLFRRAFVFGNRGFRGGSRAEMSRFSLGLTSVSAWAASGYRFARSMAEPQCRRTVSMQEK
jgi:hypothetical protein